MLGKNSQSSRAVPVAKTIEVNEEFVTPLIWGKNKPGMSSEEEIIGWRLKLAKIVWNAGAKTAFLASKLLAKLGLHKQWANRLTEPYSSIKVVLSGTSLAFENFFWLRTDSKAAQPEMVKLANMMQESYECSLPRELLAGQWHLPYVRNEVDPEYGQIFYDEDNGVIDIHTALKLSASCCAQVSYRNLNFSLDKALEIYNRLFDGDRPHYSPTEHQGMAMMTETHTAGTELKFDIGISSLNSRLQYQSGNFTGFLQYRKLMEIAQDALIKNKIKEFANN